MRQKRGWIRILEATVAVLIVSSVMVAVYSDQARVEDITPAEYSYSLQSEILDDIALNKDLRMNVLRVVDDVPSDYNYNVLDNFVKSKVPPSYGYSLRVCDLGDSSDFCKMDSIIFTSTLDKDVYVEDVVISAEIGEGSGTEVYSPKKVRFFMWEGGYPGDYCRNECSAAGNFVHCSSDLTKVMSSSCTLNISSGCFEIGSSSVSDNCALNELCIVNACKTSLHSRLTCQKKDIVDAGCSWDSGICKGYDGFTNLGGCGFLGNFGYDSYQCWNLDTYTTNCSLTSAGSCSSGYKPILTEACSSAPVVAPTKASLSMAFNNINYVFNNPTHHFYHDRVISESSGVGADLTSGTVCFGSGGCNSGAVSYRVNPSSSLSLTGHDFFTTFSSETFNLTYFGTDDNGNSVSVNAIVGVSGSSWLYP